MSDDTTGNEPPAGNEPKAPAATNPTDDTNAPAANGEPEGSTSTDDDNAAKKARAEARNLRERMKAAEAERDTLLAEKEARELAQLSEKEQAEAKAAKAEEAAAAATERAHRALAKVALSQAAIDAKLIDPSLAFDLLASKVEFDAEGEPTNAVDLVAQLVKDRPVLVNRTGPSAGGAPGAASPGQKPDGETREQKNRRLGLRTR